MLLPGDDATGLRAAASSFGAFVATDGPLERDHRAFFVADPWRGCAGADVLGATAPEHLGGRGGDLVDLAMVTGAASTRPAATYVSTGSTREPRDSVGVLVCSRTDEIQRNVIARMLGLES